MCEARGGRAALDSLMKRRAAGVASDPVSAEQEGALDKADVRTGSPCMVSTCFWQIVPRTKPTEGADDWVWGLITSVTDFFVQRNISDQAATGFAEKHMEFPNKIAAALIDNAEQQSGLQKSVHAFQLSSEQNETLQLENACASKINGLLAVHEAALIENAEKLSGLQKEYSVRVSGLQKEYSVRVRACHKEYSVFKLASDENQTRTQNQALKHSVHSKSLALKCTEHSVLSK
jgi:hypothetical protein